MTESLLQVPLQATNYPINGREHIEMWVDGKQVIVEAPFWPYFIVKENAIEWEKEPPYKAELITINPISTLRPLKAMKYSFPMVDYIRKLNNTQLKKWEDRKKSPVVENHLGFLERIAVDQPDFFRKYANTRNEFFIFDIETLSKKGEYFHDIISIAISDGKTTWYEDVSGETTEAELMEWFIGHWKRLDPDIIIGYNHKRFDLPRIFEACERNHLPIDWIGRDGKTPPLTDDYRLEEGIITGRCVFDVWEDVDADQTLNGKVKNKKLKTIAKYFGIPAITEELSDTYTLLQQPQKLRMYNESDVNATTQIFERYLHQATTIANQLGYPFDEIVNPKGARKGIEKTQKGRSKEGITTLIGRIAAARGMGQRGYVEDGKNTDRYSSLFAGKGDDQPVYQGAIVGLYRDGVILNTGAVLARLYKPVLHSDYSGMYPEIEMEANISPETTQLIGLEPYDLSVWPKGLVRSRTDTHVVLVIPDDKVMGDGRNCIIQIDQSFQGGFPEFLRELKEARNVVKKQYNAAKAAGNKADEIKFYSMQYGLKVVANACGYGSNVRKETRYGSLVVGIVITGLARYMLGSAKDFMETWEPPKKRGQENARETAVV